MIIQTQQLHDCPTCSEKYSDPWLKFACKLFFKSEQERYVHSPRVYVNVWTEMPPYPIEFDGLKLIYLLLVNMFLMSH